MNARIFYDYDMAAYHADPCPAPSLNQSIAKVIIDQSPRHAWIQHPRLNPDYEPDDRTIYDVGNVAHSLLLGRGKAIVPLSYEDWRTKEAQQKRASIAAEGRLAVLQKHYDAAEAIVVAARDQLQIMHQLKGAFVEGNAEVVLAWEEDGIWFRTAIDWAQSLTQLYDLKTTGKSVAPHIIGRLAADAGWDIQAAMWERGLNFLDPDNAGRRTYRFVAIEDKPPYAMTVVQLSEAWLMMGRKKLDYAVEQWRRCMESGNWPAYPAEIITPEYPSYVENAWLEREIAYSEAERARDEKPINYLLAG